MVSSSAWIIECLYLETTNFLEKALVREETLQGEKKTLMRDRDELREKYTRSEEHAAHLGEDLQERETQLVNARQNIDTLHGDLRKGEEKLLEAMEHNTSLEEQCKEQRGANKTLMEQNGALHDDNSNYLLRNQELTIEGDNYKTQLTQEEEKRKQLESNLTLQYSINRGLIEQTQGTVAHKDREIKLLKEKLTNATTNLERMLSGAVGELKQIAK